MADVCQYRVDGSVEVGDVDADVDSHTDIIVGGVGWGDGEGAWRDGVVDRKRVAESAVVDVVLGVVGHPGDVVCSILLRVGEGEVVVSAGVADGWREDCSVGECYVRNNSADVGVFPDGGVAGGGSAGVHGGVFASGEVDRWDDAINTNNYRALGVIRVAVGVVGDYCYVVVSGEVA